ncbi:hypothetical protein CEXT_750051 [Caerostris extrusa]|uniref:Uncharacterized protein n=1 Tax=Caerostris extrusa TaxID=172846 RepID=A0AAV4XJ75_CAEEX|nr:hypothetical protein CEXT_750051 [Caerostris extrusa]
MCDTLTFCLDLAGLEWKCPHPIPGECRKYFTEEYGDAVYRHRCAFEEAYRRMVRAIPSKVFLEPVQIMQYLQNGIIGNFNKSTIVQGLFKSCSLLVDTAIFCFRYHRRDLVDGCFHQAIIYLYEEHVGVLFEGDTRGVWQDILITGKQFEYECCPKSMTN